MHLEINAAEMNATVPLTSDLDTPFDHLFFDDLDYDVHHQEVHRAGRLLRLSPTGRKILEVLLRASPGIVSRDELEHAIWGEATPSYNILKVHVHRLRQDVDRDFAHPIIVTIPGRGFALLAR